MTGIPDKQDDDAEGRIQIINSLLKYTRQFIKNVDEKLPSEVINNKYESKEKIRQLLRTKYMEIPISIKRK